MAVSGFVRRFGVVAVAMGVSTCVYTCPFSSGIVDLDNLCPTPDEMDLEGVSTDRLIDELAGRGASGLWDDLFGDDD